MTDAKKTLRSIAPSDIPKHFEAQAAEQKWDAFWQERGTFHWDPSRPREETFVVDTPPPTVSGSLHVGHVFSYTQTDVVVRYKRMRGFNTFYPMGWDDNGLPTERRVQNFYHVRCDASLPYDPELKCEEASAKVRKGRPLQVSRRNFIELCEELTEVDEQAFKDLFTRLGLSIDWRQTYATIDTHCRRTAQLSFLDLHEKGHIYQTFAPTMWDVDFQSAVAQAEVEDRKQPGAFHKLKFGVQGSDASFVIATTRPELLPACVGVTAHPDDPRYKDLFGKYAITPLFHAPVKIFPSELADPEKGTGILMVCTFGDQTDVQWWREQKLPLRQIIGLTGRLEEATFGTDAFPSEKPEQANTYYAELAGKNVKQAQAAIVEMLRDPAGSATGDGAPLQEEPEKIDHAVKFFEKGDRPLEFVPTRQWFGRLTDKKEQMLQKGADVQWHPSFMKSRYDDWTRNLGIDWCLSRQRYFGVPIPVWFAIDDKGNVDYSTVLMPDKAQLPVDPMTDTPPGYEDEQRGKPGGFTGDKDIFDTWFTSSMTPQISSHWGQDAERHQKLFPADIRPQAHDIIRTWAFYTIAKGMLHEDKAPWKHILLSGWILDPDRKKMSKSKGNVVTPLHLLDEYSADGVRYWAASARLGVDTAFDDKVFKVGRRLVTKLYNASKFVLAQSAEVQPITHELDLAFVAELKKLVAGVTKAQEGFNYAQALLETEQFFWSRFTDTYLELAKARAWGGEGVSAEAQGSAVAALRLGLSVLLRLFAPVLPYITEEVWSWVFAEERGEPTIHAAAWPGEADFAGIAAPASEGSMEVAVECVAAINKAKADASVSVGRAVTSVELAAKQVRVDAVKAVLSDVLDATRTQQHAFTADEGVEEGFKVKAIEFAPAEPKK